MTAAQKILAHASGKHYVDIGEIVYPVPELVVVHDGYVQSAYRELAKLGYAAVRDPKKVIFVTDHEVAYSSQMAVRRGQAIRTIADQWKVGQFFDVGRGGHGHLMPIEEEIVRPGMFVFAYDMHCTNYGAIGALAVGVGPEITTVLATGTLWTAVPETLRIDLNGRLTKGAHPRDVGFLLAEHLVTGRWGTQFDNRVVEFGGEGISTLSLADRVALCNSVTEVGVASVLFDAAPPSGTKPDLVASDPRANFESRVVFDLGETEPQVACPGGPEKAAPIASVVGTPIQHSFLGSCGSGMYEDFVAAAELLDDRRVAAGVRLFVVPGTVATANRLASEGVLQRFTEAGAIVLPAGCGPCAGGLMAPLGPDEVSISTAAANHKGRFGAGDAYLASPLSVVASAISGAITDPRTIG